MVRLRPNLVLLASCCLVGLALAQEAETVDEDFWDTMVEKVGDERSCGGPADAEQSVPLRTHSIAPPYVDSDLQNRW